MAKTHLFKGNVLVNVGGSEEVAIWGIFMKQILSNIYMNIYSYDGHLILIFEVVILNILHIIMIFYDV